MKHVITLLLLVCMALGQANAQFTKKDIDVELLSSIIAEKQNEIKQRVLGDLVVNNIQTSNYAVYNTIYNLVSILTTEKNKTIMKRDLVQQIADYAVAYALTQYFYKKHLTITMEGFNKRPQEADDDMIFGGTSAVVSHKGQDVERRSGRSEIEVLMANYLLDEMYNKLKANSFMTRKGFYSQDPFRQYFTSGLEVDYTRITSDRTAVTTIDQQLNSFLNKITTFSSDVDEVFKFINSPSCDLTDMRRIKPADMVILLALFENSVGEFRDQVGKNSFIAVVGDIVAKYIMLEVGDGSIYQFEIDVESIILSMEDRFYNAQKSPLRKHAIGAQPYFTIGINYGFFINPDNQFIFNDPNAPQTLHQLALASEKIGFRFLFDDNKYRKSFAPMEWYQYKGQYYRWTSPQKQPLISNFHAIVYGSGILYNIVNLKSEENFNYPIVGAGLGVEFFNGMQTNLSLAAPIVPGDGISGMSTKAFVNIGFDIPIFTYLAALRNRP